MDLQSETRSVYKLDPNEPTGSEALYAARRGNQGGPHNLNSIFKTMDVMDREQILDKIHRMRLKVAERMGVEEPSKPYLPKMTGSEKDKIMAQYYAAKKQLKPEA